MDEMSLRVRGGNPLHGEIEVQRAKNAILAMIAASIVVEDGETVLHEVPDIEDVERACELLRSVGARVEHNRLSKTLSIDASDVRDGKLPADIASRLPRLGALSGALADTLGLCGASRQRWL